MPCAVHRISDGIEPAGSPVAAVSRPRTTPLGPEDAKKIESAIADIQFLGTPRQIELARKFATEYATNKRADLEELLSDLRNDRAHLDTAAGTLTRPLRVRPLPLRERRRV